MNPILLREPILKAQAALLRECSEAQAFERLFGWLVARAARAAGLEPARLPGEFCPASLPPEAGERLDLPDLQPLWQNPTSLGWSYQFWNAPRRAAAFAQLAGGKRKLAPEDLPAATQLFTPEWIARFLVENTLGRLWQSLHPDSRVSLAYLVPLPAPSPPAAPRLLRDITLFDPACGAMHLGLAAFDLFEVFYNEELERAGQPGWPDEPSVQTPGEIPAAILRHNLRGAEIDPRALRLAQAALAIRAGGAPSPGLRLVPGPAGSLLRAAGEPGYDCVVANPPYMAPRAMDPALAHLLRQSYPQARGELYAAFLLRCLELLRPGGRAGLLTQQSFLFLPSYAPLRERLGETAALETLLLTGPRAFPGVAGEKVNTAAFVLRREDDPVRRAVQAAACYRLERAGGPGEKQALFEAALDGKAPPGVVCRFQPGERPARPWVGWLLPRAAQLFAAYSNLSGLPGTDGNKTGDNARFIRIAASLTPEEAASGRWRVLARPAGREPYRQDFREVVDWSPEARAFYRRNPTSSLLPAGLEARAGICWSRVSSRRFCARRFPAGVIPDVSTPALYPDEGESAFLVALLNSAPGRYLLKAVNPTINYSLGDVRQLPVPPALPAQKAALTRLVQAIEAGAGGEAAAAEIDRIAFALYGFTEEEIRVIEWELGEPRRG